MWITMLIICELFKNMRALPYPNVDFTHKIQGYSSLFHCFFRKKDINLLILHQNRKLWINYLSD